jgi:opacity protein-like surface antigen
MVRLITAATLLVLAASTAAAQNSSAAEDTRTQYPVLLANSYFSVNVGAIDYPFSEAQLPPGFRVGSIAVPHVAARVALFGHEFTRYLAVQGTYMRPVRYVAYRDVNGDQSTHHVWMHFGGVTMKARAPIANRVSIFGEGGLGITSRSGFEIGTAPVVRDTHYAAPLAGGGVEYHVSSAWDLTAGVLYSPGRARDAQPRTIFTSGGFRYTMRPLSQERVDANRSSGAIFPVNVLQVELSTGYGYGVNRFVSRQLPVFWFGNVNVDRGVAAHYTRNVFHSRRLFALDVGSSVSGWRSQGERNRFYTLSIYPLLRFTFLRTSLADLYAVYSLAGPTYISQVLIDGRDTGNHFTFQDFMGAGLFVGRKRNVTLGVKINHYSNGNIFTENAGLKIPITFTTGITF